MSRNSHVHEVFATTLNAFSPAVAAECQRCDGDGYLKDRSDGTNVVDCGACNGSGKRPSREVCLEAQKLLCRSRGYPQFIPSDGICSDCKGDMVTGNEDRWFGHMTGCPLCQHSYCD